jgi:hypothetical protein
LNTNHCYYHISKRKDQRLNFLTSLSPKTFKSKEIELQNLIFFELKAQSSKSFLPVLLPIKESFYQHSGTLCNPSTWEVEAGESQV